MRVKISKGGDSCTLSLLQILSQSLQMLQYRSNQLQHRSLLHHAAATETSLGLDLALWTISAETGLGLDPLLCCFSRPFSAFVVPLPVLEPVLDGLNRQADSWPTGPVDPGPQVWTCTCPREVTLLLPFQQPLEVLTEILEISAINEKMSTVFQKSKK